MPQDQLEQIAQDLVQRAIKAGATAADATVREGDEFSTTVRLGKIENLKEAASKALGLRVFLGTRSASSYSSDFSNDSLQRLVERTLAMARVTSEDIGQWPAGGGGTRALRRRPEALFARPCRDLGRRAHRTGAARRRSGPRRRCAHSQLGSAQVNEVAKAYSNSLGFVGSYQASFGSISVVPVAQEGATAARACSAITGMPWVAAHPPCAIRRLWAARLRRAW